MSLKQLMNRRDQFEKTYKILVWHHTHPRPVRPLEAQIQKIQRRTDVAAQVGWQAVWGACPHWQIEKPAFEAPVTLSPQFLSIENPVITLNSQGVKLCHFERILSIFWKTVFFANVIPAKQLHVLVGLSSAVDPQFKITLLQFCWSLLRFLPSEAPRVRKKEKAKQIWRWIQSSNLRGEGHGRLIFDSPRLSQARAVGWKEEEGGSGFLGAWREAHTALRSRIRSVQLCNSHPPMLSFWEHTWKGHSLHSQAV